MAAAAAAVAQKLEPLLHVSRARSPTPPLQSRPRLYGATARARRLNALVVMVVVGVEVEAAQAEVVAYRLEPAHPNSQSRDLERLHWVV